MGISKNGWFVRENAIKMDDLRVPPFQETFMYGNVWDIPSQTCAGLRMFAMSRVVRCPGLKSLLRFSAARCSWRMSGRRPGRAFKSSRLGKSEDLPAD